MKVWFLISNMLLFCLTALSQDGITAKEFFEHVNYLASDKLEGRLPGTKGNKRAAKYIAKQFKRSGLQKFDRSYYQEFEVLLMLNLSNDSYVKVGDTSELIFNRDFSVFSFSGNGKADTSIVWLGNQYELLDEKSLVYNKWVAMLRVKPSASTNDYSLARKAAQNGVAGVVFINDSAGNDNLVRLRPGRADALTIPVIQFSRDRFKRLYSSWFNGSNVDSEKAIGKTSDKNLSAFIKVDQKRVKTNNVVGFIEGRDSVLKREYIILGAHYDHLGRGGYGTGSLKPDTVAIHNGADDNASGTSALLEIAQELSRNKEELKRSVIIVAFGAEEEGLLGSSYFVDHLPVSRDAVKVMINMDMVGRLNTESHLYMGGAGTFPEGVELMKELGKGSGLNLIVHAGGVGGSDHVSFYRKEISAVGMHTGGHPQYHTPADDAPLINAPGAEKVSRYIFRVVTALCNRNQTFKFIKQDN
jgi:hypothetical protein